MVRDKTRISKTRVSDAFWGSVSQAVPMTQRRLNLPEKPVQDSDQSAKNQVTGEGKCAKPQQGPEPRRKGLTHLQPPRLIDLHLIHLELTRSPWANPRFHERRRG